MDRTFSEQDARTLTMSIILCFYAREDKYRLHLPAPEVKADLVNVSISQIIKISKNETNTERGDRGDDGRRELDPFWTYS